VEPTLITSQNSTFRRIGARDICSEIPKIARQRYKYGERTSSTILADRHFGFRPLESRDFCPKSPEVASCDRE
jgi:hypothetical protein